MTVDDIMKKSLEEIEHEDQRLYLYANTAEFKALSPSDRNKIYCLQDLLDAIIEAKRTRQFVDKVAKGVDLEMLEFPEVLTDD
jgi:hypothetical protein